MERDAVLEQRAVGGRWITATREERGLKQAALARALGVTRSTITGYEDGRTGVAEWRVPELARALGRSVTETRRALGFYVPDDVRDEGPTPSVLDAIKQDPYLLPEAKEHLTSQYGLLLRVQSATTEQAARAALTRQVEAEIDALPEPEANRVTEPEGSPSRRSSDLR